jgi:hypothetical protein
MKKRAIIVVLGMVFILSLACGTPANGHGGWHGSHGGHGGHGHDHGGWYGGHFYYGWYGPWWYPYAYPYPYPYPYYDDYPSTGYPSASVPVPNEPQQSYWYYCNDSAVYYPYVTSCRSGWVPVVPTQPTPGSEGPVR